MDGIFASVACNFRVWEEDRLKICMGDLIEILRLELLQTHPKLVKDLFRVFLRNPTG